MATKLTRAQQCALRRLASPPLASRPELQHYSAWRLECSSNWRFIPGVSARTRAWLVSNGYAERHPSTDRDMYYAHRITDRGREALRQATADLSHA
ncbi:hypothetical protein [Mycolicibacterium llatzerense]|uniref:hypothetical protein n=1 Tax=Mycolicibacterium llatzerense TaxID=280871 RepID=UPI0021B58C9B|nr:hypothetical protein [Mycolicibacterium llatzerense]MCT7371893.1 hypothetical protein [Mycolicibacterium llatzerense]